MQDNRRKHPRVELRVLVNCDQNYTAESEDVSEGGMCIVFDEEMEKGRMLDLRFSLPDSAKPVKAFGRVQWSRKNEDGRYATGVSFWSIAQEDKSRLVEFLKTGVS